MTMRFPKRDDATKVNLSSKGQYFLHSIMDMLVHKCQEDGQLEGWRLEDVLWSTTCALVPPDANRVLVLAIARLLVGVAQGFVFCSRSLPMVHGKAHEG
ncbi:hypothetical protein K1719_035905 [Acacia pycnantha]|nr:hypothetical protein K1719_035905 [Acacia pycnantha]